jgi:hypothetical protein
MGLRARWRVSLNPKPGIRKHKAAGNLGFNGAATLGDLVTFPIRAHVQKSSARG